MTQAPLLNPLALVAAGAAVAGAWALVWWPRRHRPRPVGWAMVAGLALGPAIGWLVDYQLRLFGAPTGWVPWQWLGFVLVVVAAALTPRLPAARRARERWGRRLALDGTAILLAALGALLGFNYHFAMYRTPADLFRQVESAALPDAPDRDGDPAIDRTAQAWEPQGEIPAKGTVATIKIPGTTSGFVAREGRVYLPPAYAMSPRPQLPVLILMVGQPGYAEHWVQIGHVDEIMDAYAAEHHGVAPVVVMPDHIGAPDKNPLCSNAHEGKNATYLEDDVRTWILDNLDVDPDTHRWAVAGLSNGGTCATQLATRRPDLFRIFASLSGEEEPSLGDRTRTIATGFGGDRAAFEANNPLDLMARRTYPSTLGLFTVGDKDAQFGPGLKKLAEAGTKAGMDARLLTIPGGHDWAAWIGGLKAALPIMLPRMGLW